MIGWFLKFIHGKDKKNTQDRPVDEPLKEIRNEHKLNVSPCIPEEEITVEYETIEESIEKIDEYEERDTLSESISAVFKELNEMPQEEFDALIDEELKKMEENKCDPATCGGECQGMGWCDTAREFREKIIPTIINK